MYLQEELSVSECVRFHFFRNFYSFQKELVWTPCCFILLLFLLKNTSLKGIHCLAFNIIFKTLFLTKPTYVMNCLWERHKFYYYVMPFISLLGAIHHPRKIDLIIWLYRTCADWSTSQQLAQQHEGKCVFLYKESSRSF